LKIGALTEKGKDRRLLILKILAEKGPLSLTKLAKEIEVLEKGEKGSYRSIRGRLGNPDGPLYKLQLSEYIQGKKFDGSYERSEMEITYKGLFAIFSILNDEERFFFSSKLQLTRDMFDKIKNPLIKYHIIGCMQDLDYFYLFLKVNLPIIPIIVAWMTKTRNAYLNFDLDNIYNETIIQDMIESAEKVLNIICLLMRSDGLLGYYFEDDFGMILERTRNWMNSHDNMKNIHIELALRARDNGLAKNNLLTRKTVTNYERRIIEKIVHFQETRFEAEKFGIQL
jgi:hypothetical protein